MLLVGCGLVLLLGGVGASSPGLAIAGALVLGLGLCSAASLVLRWVLAPRSEGVAAAGSTRDGLPMLVVAAPRTTLLVPVAALVWVVQS